MVLAFQLESVFQWLSFLGLKKEGLFSTAGSHVLVQEMKEQYEKIFGNALPMGKTTGTISVLNNPAFDPDVGSVFKLLKAYFNELASPVQ